MNRNERFTIPHTKEELADILNTLVQKVDSPEQMLYWQVTRGTAPRNSELLHGKVFK